MKFNTYINNVKCLEWGLNSNQGALFDLLFQTKAWAKYYTIGTANFYWLSRDKILQELPLFYKTADTVYRHLKILQSKGLIKYRKIDNRDVFHLTEKGNKWGDFSTPDSRNENSKTRKLIRKNSDSNPTYNITTTLKSNHRSPQPPLKGGQGDVGVSQQKEIGAKLPVQETALSSVDFSAGENTDTENRSVIEKSFTEKSVTESTEIIVPAYSNNNLYVECNSQNSQTAECHSHTESNSVTETYSDIKRNANSEPNQIAELNHSSLLEKKQQNLNHSQNEEKRTDHNASQNIKNNSSGKRRRKPVEPIVPIDKVMALYNHYNHHTGGKLQTASDITPERIRAFNKIVRRLREPTFECINDYFFDFFKNLTPFYQGENKSHWRANFDYLLRPYVLTKTREQQ